MTLPGELTAAVTAGRRVRDRSAPPSGRAGTDVSAGRRRAPSLLAGNRRDAGGAEGVQEHEERGDGLDLPAVAVRHVGAHAGDLPGRRPVTVGHVDAHVRDVPGLPAQFRGHAGIGRARRILFRPGVFCHSCGLRSRFRLRRFRAFCLARARTRPGPGLPFAGHRPSVRDVPEVSGRFPGRVAGRNVSGTDAVKRGGRRPAFLQHGRPFADAKHGILRMPDGADRALQAGGDGRRESGRGYGGREGDDRDIS